MKEKDIIIGHHAAVAALKNQLRKIISIKCTKEFFKKHQTLIEKKRIKKLKIVDRKLIDLEVKNNFHQGVLIECNSLKRHNIDSITLNEKIIIILDSLNDSQNVGSILRSAYLFGVKTVIFNKNNSFEINSILIKSASGAFEKIKLIEVVNLNRTIETLKDQGFWILGLDINSKDNLDLVPGDVKKVIIFGSENKGIRPLIKKNCDFLTKIQLPVIDTTIDSLNVSNSVSITLYELLKNERNTKIL